MLRLFLLCLFSLSCLCAESISKHQITYLMQAGEVEKSVALYERYQKSIGKHDFEILQQMALILLDNGARSHDKQTQLLSIFGSGIASVESSLDILEAGVKSEHGETQMAAIQYLGQMQDDRSDELLIKAMSSPFFAARMEAASFLAQRKHRASVGQIESLMYRVPPPARFFFPQFFALIGTSDAISILSHLMEDRYPNVRVEAILSAARFGRDDLLSAIRMNLTHVNIAEQEAAAFAVGLLNDSRSIKKLQRALNSSTLNVQLAAAHSLHLLGDPRGKEFLIEQASKGDLFAITTLATIEEGKNTLATLCTHRDLAVRLNAAIALSKHRDKRCIGPLLELFVRNVRDLGLSPQISIGRTMLAFKPVFSTAQQTNTTYDVRSATLAIRQQLLVEAMHFPETDFLNLANRIFLSGQTDLIPTLVLLLENLQTPPALALLEEKAQEVGRPLVRAYANLALYRMGKQGPYKDYLIDWIDRHKTSEMIRFEPIIPMNQRIEGASYELAPQDSSRLLIESFQTLAEKQHNISLQVLLDAMQTGNSKNRYVLAGLLLRALQ